MANIVLSILGNDKTGPATKSATGNMTRLQELANRTKLVALGAGAAAAAGVGAILKTGFDEAKDASAGQAQLEAAIKSTGGAAGVTVQHMEDLAGSIQGYSGQTDDSIVKTQSLLLTFTNIKNSGPDKIFDAATRAAADMAARMGGDASSKAVLLGKALNDPVKGITALTRVGVAFTTGQKEQIASMVKAGDTAGAQKIILSELNKEFGGSAEAAGKTIPGQMARAQRSFEDLSQGVVEALLPIMSAVLPALIQAIKGIAPVLQDMAKWLSANRDIIPVLAAAVAVVAAAIGTYTVVTGAANAVTTLFGTATQAGAIKTIAMTGALAAQKVALAASTAAQWLFNAAASANPIGLVILAIVALIAIIVLLVTHWSEVTTFLRTVWNRVVIWLQDTLTSIGSWWRSTWNGVIGFFRTIWNALVSFGMSVIRNYVNAVRSTFSGIVTWLRGLWNGFLGFFRGLWNGLVSFGTAVVRGYVSTVRGGFSGVVSFLRGLFSGFLSFWRGVWNNVTSFVSGIPGRIRGVFSGIGGWLVSSGRSLIDGFTRGIRNAIGGAIGAAKGVVDAVARFFPHSPAPEGPFSGRGYTTYSGAALIDGFTSGITSRAGNAKSTISNVLGGLVPSLSMTGLGLGGAASAGATVAGSSGFGGGLQIGELHTHNGANAAEIVNEISWQARRMPV